jgi:hypothetical protein
MGYEVTRARRAMWMENSTTMGSSLDEVFVGI